jgi:hypothetical protein
MLGFTPATTGGTAGLNEETPTFCDASKRGLAAAIVFLGAECGLCGAANPVWNAGRGSPRPAFHAFVPR